MPFDPRFYPPAPVEPFVVAHEGQERSGHGLLDTGASTSIFPVSVVPREAEEDSWRRVSFGAGVKLLRSYILTVTMLGGEAVVLAAVAPPDQLAEILGLVSDSIPDEGPPALIGRDVLNETRWVFDGPGQRIAPL